MNILIAGSGALGSLAGAYLSGNNQVTLYGREKHIGAIRQRGLEIIHKGKTENYSNLNTISDAEQDGLCGQYDLVILGVKAYGTFEMLQLIEGKTQFGFIASLQNGLKDDLLIQRFGRQKTLGCVMDEAAQITAPGIINYTNSGNTYFGTFSGEKNQEKQEISRQLAISLENRLAHVEAAKDLDIIAWYKNMTSVPVFAFQGAMNMNAAQMTDRSIWRTLYKELILETLAIAKAERIHLNEHRMLKDYYLHPEKIDQLLDDIHTVLVALDTPPICSLLQDLKKGKTQTELNYILWPMITKAKEHNLQIPLLEETYFSILKVQQSNLIMQWKDELDIVSSS
jgi:2-dehydropantoate 2-reductase